MAAETLNAPLLEVLPLPRRLVEPLLRLKVRRLIDLLNHFPRSYNQRLNIAQLTPGIQASIVARVVSCTNTSTRKRRLKLTELTVEDGTATLKAVFFNQPWLVGKFPHGLRVRLTGPVDFSFGAWSMKPSSWEANPPDEPDGLRPEYPLSEGIDSADIAAVIEPLLERADEIPDILPEKLAAELKLMPVGKAYRAIHRPANNAELKQAALALKYREFFLLQCGLRVKRADEADDTTFRVSIDDDLRARALRYFPFEMTAAQKRVICEIEADVASPGAMERLLQGDVGCGKTAVALYAALLLIDNGYQAAVIAPTEVLARQHYKTLTGYLAETKVKIDLLLGGMKKAGRDELLADLGSGRTHILVGTHALLEDDVQFNRLGLCVIDEQHKFGVRQRATIRAKGRVGGSLPHVLAMSATPIPRTLSMTLYGAMDVSIIDELPPGRTPVETRWVQDSGAQRAFEQIRHELRGGGRAYFIYPLVEESDALDAKSAIEHAERLRDKEFSEFRVGLVHGRMKPEEKEAAMEAFRRGELDVLAATVVVEVGVDVPEANVMVIENSERFGLSQLHQLRGRIGRGRRKSYLYLMGEPHSEEAIKRLNVICATNDGFRIAEEDLKMRGFGDFAGTRQSGLPRLRIADFVDDAEILARARMDAARHGSEVPREVLRDALKLHFGAKLENLGA